MNEDQKRILIKQLESSSTKGKRRFDRKTCVVTTTYANKDRKFEGYIVNISNRGAFIETKEVLPVGQEIVLNFSLPRYKKPLKLIAKVVRSNADGMGVNFVGNQKLVEE
jgi:Tfp pilus assembly protein PilZ